MIFLTAKAWNNDKPITPIEAHGSGLDEPYLAESEITYGYLDISSITNWYELGLQSDFIDRDYLYFLDRIRDLTVEKAIAVCLGEYSDPSLIENPLEEGDRYCVGKDGINEFDGRDGLIGEWDGSGWVFLDKEFLGYELADREEQRICMELRIGDPYLHDNHFGAETAQQWRDDYHNKSIPVRAYRMQRAETLIQDQLSPYKTPIMASLTSEILEINIGFGKRQYCFDHHKNYKSFGTRGSVEDYHAIENPTGGFGVMDFIYGRSIFTGRGLINMPWKPKSMTMQEVCDKINAILVLGDFS